VRNTLFSETHVGGTLTLTGSGTQTTGARLTQSALTVHAGATIVGTSTHGSLVVNGESSMAGPLALSDLHGPVHVSNPSAQATASTASTLVVTGGSTVDSLKATAVASSTLTAATSAHVQGVDASPLALANHFKNFQNSLVTVVRQGTSTTSTLGLVQQGQDGSLYVLTSGLYDYNVPQATYSSGDTVSVVAFDGTAVPASVLNTSASGSVAFLAAPALSSVLTPQTTAFETGDDGDTLQVGTPVWVPRYENSSGALSFAAGYISHPSVQLLDTFPSAAVTLTSGSQLSPAEMGAPVFVATRFNPDAPITSTFKVVALLQHGCPQAATAFLPPLSSATSPALAQTVGGIRGRFLQFMLNTLTAAPVPTAASIFLPALFATPSSSAPLQLGGVSPIHRAVIPALQTTGVIAPNPTGASDQVVVVTHQTGAATLGSVYQNYPSASDVALTAYVGAGGSAGTASYSTGDIGTPTNFDVSDFDTNTAYMFPTGNFSLATYLSSAPNFYIPFKSTPPFAYPSFDTYFLSQQVEFSNLTDSYALTSIYSTDLFVAFPAVTATSFFVLGFSTGNGVPTSSNVDGLYYYGSFTAVNAYMTAPANASYAIAAFWGTPTLPSNLNPDTTPVMAIFSVGLLAFASGLGSLPFAILSPGSNIVELSMISVSTGPGTYPALTMQSGTTTLDLLYNTPSSPASLNYGRFGVYTNMACFLNTSVSDLTGLFSDTPKVAAVIQEATSAPSPLYVVT
jgi:hypothetical protein